MMLNKWLYRRLPYFIRRRISPQQSPFVLVVALASLVIVLQALSFLSSANSGENPLIEPKKARPRRPLSGPLVGVLPENSHLFAPDADSKFTCVTSGKKIPFDEVNDDYCDCDDQSDEPSTGACPDSVFHCTYQGHSSYGVKQVPASKINDGICDCCDGSDEWKSNQPLEQWALEAHVQAKLGRYQTPCPKLC